MSKHKLMKFVGNVIGTIALASSLFFNSGCVPKHYKTYTTIPSSSIVTVKPVEQLEKRIDYSKMTYQEAINYVKHPYVAQDYLDRHLIRTQWHSGNTFKNTHKERKGACLSYAIAAAALLSDDDYQSILLVMEGLDHKTGKYYGHVVFPYKSEKGFGALGNTYMPAKYSTLNDLVKAFSDEHKFTPDKYLLIDLNKTFPNKEWIDSDVNLQLPRKVLDYIEVK